MKKKRVILIGILVGFALAIGLFLFLRRPKSLHTSSLRIGGISREFYYYVPSNLSKNPKLIFVLHGSKMKATVMQKATGYEFDKLAVRSGDCIIVYPQGYEDYWNDCRKSEVFDAKKMKVDELGFFEQMIQYFRINYGLDTNHVFAAGYSNGAQMCFKLAMENPDLFKGFAAVCGNLPIETNEDCFQLQRPVSMLLMNGTADPINPYNGGMIANADGMKRGEVVSTQSTIAYWQNLNKDDSATMTKYDFPDIDINDNSTAIKYSYHYLRTGKEIVFVKVTNGGHIFPNPGFSSWPEKLGNANKDINAPEIIFNYFYGLK